MRNKIVVVTCGFLIFALQAAGVCASDLMGQWSGTVYQTGPGNAKSTYSAKMVLNGATGTMDYPSLGCGGTITFQNKNGNMYFYRESINYGQKKCIDGGMIAVEPSGNTVQWAWNGGGATVSGQLSGSRTLPSCNQCGVARDNCHTGCNSHASLQSQAECVNRCNAQYSCVMGYDCK